MKLLDQTFNAASSYQPMKPTQVAALLAKTAGVAREGNYELFKTSERFDSTVKNPEFLM